MSDDHRLHEVEQALRQSIGNNMIMELHFKKCPRRQNQACSTINCLDMINHFLRMRKKQEDACCSGRLHCANRSGVIGQRAKRIAGRQALFFLAYLVWWLEQSSQYVLFYIPQFLFNDVRTALTSPHASAASQYQIVHWLGDVNLKDHVWLQLRFSHLANTAMALGVCYFLL